MGGGIAFNDGDWWRFFYCTVLNLLNLIICLIGSSLFAKTNVAILGIVCLTLLSSVVSFLSRSALEVKYTNIILPNKIQQ